MYNKDKRLDPKIPVELDYKHILLGQVNELAFRVETLKALVDKIVRGDLV